MSMGPESPWGAGPAGRQPVPAPGLHKLRATWSNTVEAQMHLLAAHELQWGYPRKDRQRETTKREDIESLYFRKLLFAF